MISISRGELNYFRDAILGSDFVSAKQALKEQPGLIDCTDLNDNSTLLHVIRNKPDDPRLIEIVKFLLENGANPFLITQKDLTALDIAKINRNTALVKILLEHEKNFAASDSNEIKKDHGLMIKLRVAKSKGGHVLGLSGGMKIRLPDNDSFDVTLTGNPPHYSIATLNSLVSSFIRSGKCTGESREYFKKIQHSLCIESDYLNCEPEITTQSLLNEYHSGQLITPNCGWKDHDVGIAIYNGYLVVSNRGDRLRRDEGGVIIYKIKSDFVMTQEFIESLKPAGSPLDAAIIRKRYMDIVDPTAEKIVLTAKDQKHGTCSFVNPKASMKGILYLLKKEELRKAWLERPGFAEHKQGLNHKDAKIRKKYETMLHDEAESYSTKQYKLFTKFMRDYQLNEFLNELQKSIIEDRQGDSDFYKDLLVIYVNQHHSKKTSSPKKAYDELERFKYLLFGSDRLEARQYMRKALYENASLNPTLESTLNELFQKNPSFINEPDKQGITPLVWKCIHGKFKDAVNLMKLGASPVTQDKNGESIAMHLIKNSGDLNKLLSILHQYYGNKKIIKEILNAKNNKGETVLMLVCQLQDKKLYLKYLSELIKYGVDVNIQDHDGNTALMRELQRSAEERNPGLIKILLMKTKDEDKVKIKNKVGKCVIDLVADSHVRDAKAQQNKRPHPVQAGGQTPTSQLPPLPIMTLPTSNAVHQSKRNTLDFFLKNSFSNVYKNVRNKTESLSSSSEGTAHYIFSTLKSERMKQLDMLDKVRDELNSQRGKPLNEVEKAKILYTAMRIMLQELHSEYDPSSWWKSKRWSNTQSRLEQILNEGIQQISTTFDLQISNPVVEAENVKDLLHFLSESPTNAVQTIGVKFSEMRQKQLEKQGAAASPSTTMGKS